jgi:hypothetical protein
MSKKEYVLSDKLQLAEDLIEMRLGNVSERIMLRSVEWRRGSRG